MTSIDHIYFNLTYTNETLEPQLVRIYEQTSEPFLKNCQDYEMTVCRFSLPLTHCSIFTFSDNWFSVTLRANNHDYQVFLTHVTSSSDPSNRDVYSYQQFCNSINNGLQAAYTAMNAVDPGLATAAPYLVFDAASQLFRIYAETDYVTNAIDIYFNHNLYAYFENFDVINYGLNQTNGKDIKFRLQDNKINSDFANYYWLEQDYSSVNLWYDIRSIVFTSSSLPIQKEFLKTNVSSTSGTSNSNIAAITDFEIDLSSGSRIRSYAQYVPAQYRWCDLRQQDSLNQIDVSIWYKTYDGILRALSINPYESVTIKVLFRKRGA